MFYSTHPPNSNTYFEVMPKYYVLRSEWFDKKRYSNDKHKELCHCFASRRKKLMFTGQSACAILDIPRLDEYDLRPHSITDKVKGTDIVCWRRGEFDQKAKMVEGLLTASPARAICDLAKYDSKDSLLVSINHCLSKRLFTKKQLLIEIARRPGMRWKNKLLKVLKVANFQCESPLETITYLAIHRGGFVLPEQQIRLTKHDNRQTFLGRVDMLWRLKKKRVILELDGASKYTDEGVFPDEKRRENRLRWEGYEVIRAMWRDVVFGDIVKKLEEIGIPKRRYRKRKILIA